MNAHPSDQRALLVVREHDTALLQLRHRLRALPQQARIDELTAEDLATAGERAVAWGAVEDARTELRRIETDVELVETRIARDTERESASSSVKDVTALETEIHSLRDRLALLEDAELAVMERVESAEKAVALIDGRTLERADAIAALRAEQSSAAAEIEAEIATQEAERQTAAAIVGAELIAAYEARRARTGVGAGLLRQRSCGACSIELTGSDLERIRQLADDAVTFCPDCDAILVRTEESGL